MADYLEQSYHWSSVRSESAKLGFIVEETTSGPLKRWALMYRISCIWMKNDCYRFLLQVCSILKRIANLGLIVVAVIHQPRTEIVEQLDDVLLLRPGGKTVFLGPTKDLVPYFENDLGFAVSLWYKPWRFGFLFDPDKLERVELPLVYAKTKWLLESL